MHEPTNLLEPEDLLRIPDGDWYELLDGHAVEKVKGAYSSWVCGRLAAPLIQFVRQERLGHVFGGRTGYACFAGRPRHLRRPDLSFVAYGRFENEVVPDFDIELVPDLCVEVTAPADTYDSIEQKVTEFLAAGVRLFWTVSPEAKTVVIRRPDKSAATLDVTDRLDGESVVPGFSCRVADLFA